jgi:proteasome lid subunit RPN8/RPN11
MITITSRILEDIRRHGESSYPEEGAGLILGKVDGDERFADQILPLTNQFEAALRNRRYLITPQDMIKAEEIAEGNGREIIGIFHSHPDHPARPSEFDREQALPWYSYLITSVRQSKAHESRVWRLTEERKFNEENLVVYRESQLEE